MEGLTDDELMCLYRDGDADAFDVLFDRHYAAVYNFARTVLDGGVGADDVLQDTFIAVARGAADYVPRGRFRPWLMRIARSRCLDCLRSAGRRLPPGTATPDGVHAVPSRQPSPLQSAEGAEAAREMRRMLAALPERQREALALYAFEGMTYREIASALGSPVNTVKTLIHRARATLAGRMQHPEEHQDP